MEPFDVPQPRERRSSRAGAAPGRSGAESGMRERRAERGGLEEAGDAAAAVASACRTSTRARLEHAAEIEAVVAILAGGDLHASGRPVAQQAQASRSSDETGSSNQVTPSVGEALGESSASLRE